MAIKCIVIIVLLFISNTLFACDPPVYLLFNKDAKARLNSLQKKPSPDNMMERIILMHNIAFHKNNEIREEAEMLVNEYNDNYMDSLGQSSILWAYSSSLKLIKIRDRGLLKNIGKTVFTLGGLFGNNPYEEAYEAFGFLTEALDEDTTDIRIRMLRASAAVESAEHLEELMKYALDDLKWLSFNMDKLKPSEKFFMFLSWVKYYYKKNMIEKDLRLLDQAFIYADLARKYACCDDFIYELDKWELKLKKMKEK